MPGLALNSGQRDRIWSIDVPWSGMLGSNYCQKQPIVRTNRHRGVLVNHIYGTQIAPAQTGSSDALEPLLQVPTAGRLRHDAGKLRQALRQSLDHVSEGATQSSTWRGSATRGSATSH